MNYYRLEGHEPVKVENIAEWARWFEATDRTVALTWPGDCMVSTVFLGLDCDWSGEGAPVLFETIVISGERDEYCRRYCTWDEAGAGHAEVVALVAGEIVTLTCPDCGDEFEMPRWQYEAELAVEGDDWQPSCLSCCGGDLVMVALASTSGGRSR